MEKQLRDLLLTKQKLAIPIAFAFASVLIVFFVIFPQFSAISQTRNDINDKKQHVDKLQQSLQVLNSQSTEQIDHNFALTDKALPNTKNIIAIFNALSYVASSTGTSLNSFTLQVGNIYRKSTSKINADSQVQGVPTLTVAANIQAENQLNVVQFVDALYKALPLTEVKNVNVLSNTGDIQINFFYKPYNIQQVAGAEEIPPLDTAEQKTISTLQQWDMK